MAMPIVLLVLAAFSDDVYLVDVAVQAFGMLLYLAGAIAGLSNERKPWLGTAGLAALVSIYVLLSYLDLGRITPSERTAYAALRNDDAEGMRAALAQGVDPNSYDYDWGYLLTAAAAKDPAMVKVLIDAGADVNIRDGKKSTPLLKAVYLHQCGAARLLLKAGASLDDRFYDYADYTDPPTYYKKNVREIYQGKKIAEHKKWEWDPACWLQFEEDMKHPPRPRWTIRRMVQQLVLMFA